MSSSVVIVVIIIVCCACTLTAAQIHDVNIDVIHVHNYVYKSTFTQNISNCFLITVLNCTKTKMAMISFTVYSHIKLLVNDTLQKENVMYSCNLYIQV